MEAIRFAAAAFVTVYDWATDAQSLLHLLVAVTVLLAVWVYAREIIHYLRTTAPPRGAGLHDDTTTTRNDRPPA